MRIRSIRMTVAAMFFACTTSACSYSGDGKFEAEGIWPFVNYSLELPEFQFVKDFAAEFDLAGYKSHGRSMLELIIRSPEPIAFYELNAVVEVKVSDNLGTTYFYRKGPLNMHYVRMAGEGEASWPLETEWNTTFHYGEPDIDNRAVPFIVGGTPKPDISSKYWHFMPTGSRDLMLSVKVGGVPDDLRELTGRISIRSGWK